MQLLKFYADWCGPCKIMQPVAEKIAQENNLELVEVNVDNDIELARQYDVRGIPTLVLLDEDANEIARHTGSQTQARVTAALGLTA